MNYKKTALDFWNDNEIKLATNPEDFDGDTHFGTCEITGETGGLESMVFVGASGEEFTMDVLEDLAYALHGLAGAY